MATSEEEHQIYIRDMRPFCQADQVAEGPCEAQSGEEKLRDQLRRGEERINPKPERHMKINNHILSSGWL